MANVNPHIRPLALTLARHELSDLFGDMSPDEQEELQADIKANGLREPIMLHEGKVLDGWHRYKAMCALGRRLTPKNSYTYDEEQDGPDPRKWVTSKNLMRRQLPAAERIRLAAELLGYSNTGTGRKGTNVPITTMKDVAKAAGVSEKTVKRTLGQKGTNVPISKAPTLEALRKKEKALEAQLAEVRASILQAEKEAVSPSKAVARPGARVRSR